MENFDVAVENMYLFSAIVSILGIYLIIVATLVILKIVAQWKIFTKAGEKGWKSLIPVYNMVILFKISGLSPWLLLLFLLGGVPVIGWLIPVVLLIVSMVKLGQAFGKSTGFIIGLIFLPPIFEMILAFGSSKYVKVESKTSEDLTNTDI